MLATNKALSTWYPETLVFKLTICHVLKRLLGLGAFLVLLGLGAFLVLLGLGAFLVLLGLGAFLVLGASWLLPCCMVTPWNEKQQQQIALQKCEVQFVTEILCVFDWGIWMSVVVYAVY